ncbi:MAG TPA: response regulator transcription factor [Bacteroidia bacterium]|nr:response regulator transcription factor [Bacteroidia bacterium]
MEKIKLIIVEDDTEIRNATQLILQTEPTFEITGVYENGKQFIEDFKNKKADVVLMDIQMPEMNGIEVVRIAKAQRPEVQFLMCTIFENYESIYESLLAGATGYMLKNTPANKLFDAIKDIHAGGSPMSTQIARMVINHIAHPKSKGIKSMAELSARENEVLQLLSEGLLYKEIAERLFISQGTVRQHIHKIYDKLQVQNRTEALNKASL